MFKLLGRVMCWKLRGVSQVKWRCRTSPRWCERSENNTKIYNISFWALIIRHKGRKPESGSSTRALKVQCCINMKVVAGDGRQTWFIVLNKINNVSCITVYYFVIRMWQWAFTWTWVVQVPADKSTALLIWRVRWGLVSQLSDRHTETPSPGVNPWRDCQ